MDWTLGITRFKLALKAFELVAEAKELIRE
jgi:hypothetical protein